MVPSRRGRRGGSLTLAAVVAPRLNAFFGGARAAARPDILAEGLGRGGRNSAMRTSVATANVLRFTTPCPHISGTTATSPARCTQVRGFGWPSFSSSERSFSSHFRICSPDINA